MFQSSSISTLHLIKRCGEKVRNIREKLRRRRIAPKNNVLRARDPYPVQTPWPTTNREWNWTRLKHAYIRTFSFLHLTFFILSLCRFICFRYLHLKFLSWGLNFNLALNKEGWRKSFYIRRKLRRRRSSPKNNVLRARDPYPVQTPWPNANREESWTRLKHAYIITIYLYNLFFLFFIHHPCVLQRMEWR